MSGPGYIREIFLGRPLSEDSWLNRLPALAQLRAGERLAFDSPVTFLVGENGAGKSTLLEGIAVACGFNPPWGTISPSPAAPTPGTASFSGRRASTTRPAISTSWTLPPPSAPI